MAVLSTLVSDIVADIPEVPGFIAQRQYLRALRELCESARVWRVGSILTAVAGDSTLPVEDLLPEEGIEVGVTGELVDIISIKPVDGGTPVKPKTQVWLDINHADWRSDTALTAKWYVLESNNILRLAPTPTAATQYYVRAALKPLFNTSVINDLVVNKYSELLINGAKAYLFMVPRKPWTDLTLAQYHRAQFEAGIPSARTEAAEEFQTGVARRVKYGGL